MSKKVIIVILIIVICVILGIAFLYNKRKQNNLSIDNGIDKTNSDITDNNKNKVEEIKMDRIQIKVKDEILDVKLEDNSSVTAFVEKLKNGDITIQTHDYGNFEKIGSLGFSLPTNDTRITTEPGDLILYQGNQITLYYDTNTWNFTKLGKVQNLSQEELKNILGNGDVTLTFSLDKKQNDITFNFDTKVVKLN